MSDNLAVAGIVGVVIVDVTAVGLVAEGALMGIVVASAGGIVGVGAIATVIEGSAHCSESSFEEDASAV